MENLTIEQLESQAQAINTARFLMERTYKSSEQTVNELEETYRLICLELLKRRK